MAVNGGNLLPSQCAMKCLNRNSGSKRKFGRLSLGLQQIKGVEFVGHLHDERTAVSRRKTEGLIAFTRHDDRLDVEPVDLKGDTFRITRTD